MKTVRRFCGILIFTALCTAVALAQPALSRPDKKIVSEFEKKAQRYVSLRNKVKIKAPKVSGTATPDEIYANKVVFLAAVRSARSTARVGDLFTPAAAEIFKRLIETEFTDIETSELRKAVLEADTSGVPLEINVAYPESKELVAMPSALLLTLPQLPKELRYRFIGHSLAILDRDNALIVDFMTDALP